MKCYIQFLLLSAVFLHVGLVLLRQSLVLTEGGLLIIYKQQRPEGTHDGAYLLQIDFLHNNNLYLTLLAEATTRAHCNRQEAQLPQRNSASAATWMEGG